MKYAVETESPLELSADEAALLSEMPELDGIGQSRRTFMINSAVGGVGMFAANLLAQEAALAQMPLAEGAAVAPIRAAKVVKVAFQVNGLQQTLELDSRVVLLDALRECLPASARSKAASGLGELDSCHDDSSERPGSQEPSRGQQRGSQVKFQKAPAYVELA